MTLEEAKRLIGQQRLWRIKMGFSDRHIDNVLTCTHVAGLAKVDKDGLHIPAQQAYCSYLEQGGRQGCVAFPPEEFERMPTVGKTASTGETK